MHMLTMYQTRFGTLPHDSVVAVVVVVVVAFVGRVDAVVVAFVEMAPLVVCSSDAVLVAVMHGFFLVVDAGVLLVGYQKQKQ